MTASVLCFFLVVPWVGLQCVIVSFSGHTHLLIDSDARKSHLINRSQYFDCIILSHRCFGYYINHIRFWLFSHIDIL